MLYETHFITAERFHSTEIYKDYCYVEVEVFTFTRKLTIPKLGEKRLDRLKLIHNRIINALPPVLHKGVMMTLNPSLPVAGLCFFLIIGISWQGGAYGEDDLEKLKSTGDCAGCDLSKSNLTGANLYEADLTWANLTKANLELAILDVADLTKANLTGANLTGASLHYANLTEADLTGANLTNARLDNANLTGTIFCGTKMPDESFNDSGC